MYLEIEKCGRSFSVDRKMARSDLGSFIYDYYKVSVITGIYKVYAVRGTID